MRGKVWIAIRHERRKPGATHQFVIPASRNLNIVCKNSVNVYRNPINVSKNTSGNEVSAAGQSGGYSLSGILRPYSIYAVVTAYNVHTAIL